MKYLGRLLLTAIVLICFTTLQMQAGTDTVIRFAGGQTPDVSVSNGLPVITFSPEGVIFAGFSDVTTIPYASFNSISFAVDRSEITSFTDTTHVDPSQSITVNVTLPTVTYPEPIILGNGTNPVEKTLANAKVYFSMPRYTYSGLALTPSFTVYDGETLLVANTDYTCSFSNNIHVGEATLSLEGMGDYINTSKTASFYIDKAKLTVTADHKSRVYGEVNPELTYRIKGFMESDGENNLNSLPDIATTADSVSAIGNYPITVSGGSARDYSFDYVEGVLTITPCDMSGATVTFDKDKYPYTGSPIVPSCEVVFKDTALIAGTDYALTCTNNVKAGIAVATIIGKGNYTGQIDTTFVIYEDHLVTVIINGDSIDPQPFGEGIYSYSSSYGSVLVQRSLKNKVIVYVTPEKGYAVRQEDIVLSQEYDVISEKNGLTLEFLRPESADVTLSITFVDEAILGVVPTLSEMPQPMAVYDIRGLMMANAIVSSEDEIKTCMEKLPAGLYIIRINNKTYKIQKK